MSIPLGTTVLLTVYRCCCLIQPIEPERRDMEAPASCPGHDPDGAHRGKYWRLGKPEPFVVAVPGLDCGLMSDNA